MRTSTLIILTLISFITLCQADLCPRLTEYRYANGSCLPTCESPFRDLGDGYCTSPCDRGQYMNDNQHPTSCLSYCDSKAKKIKDGFSYCEHVEPYFTCSNQYELQYENGTCTSSECEWPFVQQVSSPQFCHAPCPPGYYFDHENNEYYGNGYCSPTCPPEYTRTVGGGVLICDAFSTSLSLSVRYDISLSSFYAQDGITKFLQLLASALEIDSSRITVTRIRAGSTIIDAEVFASSRSNSTNTARAQIQALEQKFSDAAKTDSFVFNDIPVLNYSSSTTEKLRFTEKLTRLSQKEERQPEATPEEGPESKLKVLIIALGVGLFLVIIGFAVYTYKLKKRLPTVKAQEPVETPTQNLVVKVKNDIVQINIDSPCQEDQSTQIPINTQQSQIIQPDLYQDTSEILKNEEKAQQAVAEQC